MMEWLPWMLFVPADSLIMLRKTKKRIVRLGDFFNICSAASYKASLVKCSIKMQEQDHFGF